MSSSRSWTLVDQALVPEATLPVTDRGVRYGMSVFETIAVHAGRALFAHEHVQRLAMASHAAGFIFPAGLTEPLVRELVAGFPDGSLRIYVTAGDGAPAASVEASRTFLNFEQMSFPQESEYAQGWRVDVSRAPFPSILGGWKTGNYWPNVQAMHEAKRAGYQEALVLNAQGVVISASMGNVFFVQADRVLTPPVSMGARDGAVRAWVQGQSAVEEALLSADDLSEIDECFITNSRIGVMPVAALADRTLSSQEQGRRLSQLYRESILFAR